MDRIRDVNWRDVAIRAFKTFMQTFLAYFTADTLLDFTDTDALGKLALTAGISALSAALSVIWNTLSGLFPGGEWDG